MTRQHVYMSVRTYELTYREGSSIGRRWPSSIEGGRYSIGITTVELGPAMKFRKKEKRREMATMTIASPFASYYYRLLIVR